MRIKSLLRKCLFTDIELQSADLWAAFVNPENHLYFQNGELWNPAARSFNDLSWGGTRPKLGWLQGLSVTNNMLQINHFAIDKSFCQLGLGTRLAHAVGKAVKINAGITSLLFTEYTQSPAHDKFFTARLGATKQICHFDHLRYEWQWIIP
jgi:hypothetical protein